MLWLTWLCIRSGGQKFVGQFSNNKLNGYGTIFLPDGDKKLAWFEDDVPLKWYDIPEQK